MSLLRRRGRELYERLLRGHQLVIIRRTVLIIAFVPHNACKSFLDELFGYVAADGSGRVKDCHQPLVSHQLTFLGSLHGWSWIRVRRIHLLEAE
jgi:hypothetical protein